MSNQDKNKGKELTQEQLEKVAGGAGKGIHSSTTGNRFTSSSSSSSHRTAPVTHYKFSSSSSSK